MQLAEELGLSRHRCELLHSEYFAALARIAWADGMLTTDEMADLVDVANLLDISADALDAALDQPGPTVVDARRRLRERQRSPAMSGRRRSRPWRSDSPEPP